MLRVILGIAASLLGGSAYAAGKFPMPLSYAKPVGNAFVFVQLGDAVEEAKHGTASQRMQFSELRAKYAKPGLYRAADATLVWEAAADKFTPLDLTFLSDDGKILIRIEGDFWRTESFPGGIRPNEAKQKDQLNGTAVSFFRDGVLVKRYRLDELILQTETLKHTPEHLIWYAGAVLNQTTGRFLMDTQESRRIAFDPYTGDILEIREVGLANPILRTILYGAGAMTALILAGWAWFAYRHRVPDAAAS